MTVFLPLNDQTENCVDDGLEGRQMQGAHPIEDTITLILKADNEGMNERFCSLSYESVTDGAEPTSW